MSFTSEIKDELIKKYSKNSHCRTAEFLGTALTGGFFGNEGGETFSIVSDNETAAKKNFTTLRKNYNIDAELTKHCTKNKTIYRLCVSGDAKTEILKSALKTENIRKALAKDCCKRAFLRGAFIAGGNSSNPEKSYHFEIGNDNEENSRLICEIINDFGIVSKITRRRGRYYAYVKEAVDISDLLNIMEAHVSLMNFENIRIVREMRGNINRKVNCETANINKTVSASLKQAEDIRLIKDTAGFSCLDGGLKEIAEARLNNPDVPLAELGKLLSPPIGKSGVNHRLRKISQIAEDIRNKEGKYDQQSNSSGT